MREAFAALEWASKKFSVDHVSATIYDDHIAYEGFFGAAVLKNAPPEYGDNWMLYMSDCIDIDTYKLKESKKAKKHGKVN